MDTETALLRFRAVIDELTNPDQMSPDEARNFLGEALADLEGALNALEEEALA